MSEPKRELPSSGYSLLKVYATRLEVSHVEATSEGSQSTMHFGFDWRKVSDDRFDVMLRFKIDPSGERPERIVVHLVGHFKGSGTPELSIEQFANVHAVAILFPYVRQQMTTLTTSSFFGPYYLPMVNVGTLMKSHAATPSEKDAVIPASKAGIMRRKRMSLAHVAAKKR